MTELEQDVSYKIGECVIILQKDVHSDKMILSVMTERDLVVLPSVSNSIKIINTNKREL